MHQKLSEYLTSNYNNLHNFLEIGLNGELLSENEINGKLDGFESQYKNLTLIDKNQELLFSLVDKYYYLSHINFHNLEIGQKNTINKKTIDIIDVEFDVVYNNVTDLNIYDKLHSRPQILVAKFDKLNIDYWVNKYKNLTLTWLLINKFFH